MCKGTWKLYGMLNIYKYTYMYIFVPFIKYNEGWKHKYTYIIVYVLDFNFNLIGKRKLQ